MTPGNILSSVIGAIAVALLTAIVSYMRGLRSDFRRFMTEHTWLLATTLWTKDKVIKIMDQIGMPVEHPPPDDLPNRR